MDKYIGKRLDGRYEIREIIGVGGMAFVYKAYDTIDDRIVAIKILKDEYLANEEFTRRFKNESKAIAILSHPNIVKVYDVSFGERLQYIVMEYIDGITLKEYIEQQKDIKWKEAVHFTVQILRALQHAHDKGIVHRDIKPQNIMLLPDGTIKVTDFGIARFARSDIRSANFADKAIGSVHYISPEQARGEITDEKADIYSVGVMLYEMLTGRLPFEADNAVSIAIMQMQAEAVKPRDINPDIPEGLEEITVKAMQKEPAKRYQSAAEMLYDIDEFKRNPSIHFAYKYFVDETPTRFVEAITRVKGADTISAAAEEEEEPQEEHKGLPVIPLLGIITGVVVLVAILFVVVASFIGIFGPKKTDDVEVPNLIGKDYMEVVNNEEYTANFKFNPVMEPSDDVPANQIYDQSPRPSGTRKKGSKITIYISSGPRMVEIPSFSKNENKSTVKDLLTNKGFEVQEVAQPSDDVPVDCVIKLTPAPGEKAAKGSVVYMYVSTNKPVEEVDVPNVEATTLASAKATLQAAGFVVNDADIQYVNHPTYDRNYVISQTPQKNTKAAKGTAVSLVVSSGYRDVSLNLSLPWTDTPIDVQIFVGGVHSPSYSQGLAGIIPSIVGSKSITLTEQKETYVVTVYISEQNTNNPQKWMEYSVNGRTGEKIITYRSDGFGTSNPSESSTTEYPFE